jgi:hypothetical protein
MPYELFYPSYNIGSSDPLFPAILPYSESGNGITPVSVVTTLGQRAARQMNYTFPNLDGGGVVNFGLAPVPIQWLLSYVAASASDRGAFEAKFAKYLKSARRFTLNSEHGDTWTNVQMVSFVPQGEIERRGDSLAWVRVARVEFLWMQPNTTQ